MSVRREYVDFNILDEPWNRYKIADGSILKTRVILIDVRILMSPTSEKNYSGNFKYHFGYIIPSKNFVDPPNTAYSADVLKSPENLTDINFRRVSEKMNQYELDDGSTIKAKLDIKTVNKSKLPQKDGAPYYSVTIAGVWYEVRKPDVTK